jgi:hypothetical protein
MAGRRQRRVNVEAVYRWFGRWRRGGHPSIVFVEESSEEERMKETTEEVRFILI